MTWWRHFFDAQYRTLWAHTRSPEQTARELQLLRSLLPPSTHTLLDLCSGDGRLAHPLARTGLDVTAADFSLDMLYASSRQDSPAHHVQVDARALPFGPTFDAVINTQSSLGFFDTEAEQHAMFEGIARALRPGGLFLLDTVHRDHAATRDGERTWMDTPDGSTLCHQFEFDPLSGRAHEILTAFSPEGQRHTRSWSVRIYTATELTHMLARVGLHVAQVYAGFSTEPLSPHDERLLLLAKRPSQPTHDTTTRLTCPLSRQPLSTPSDSALTPFDLAARRGTLHDRAKRSIPHPMPALLLRDDHRFAYPIIDDIPRLIPEAAIPHPDESDDA